jgi:hypothetical protein
MTSEPKPPARSVDQPATPATKPASQDFGADDDEGTAIAPPPEFLPAHQRRSGADDDDEHTVIDTKRMHGA